MFQDQLLLKACLIYFDLESWNHLAKLKLHGEIILNYCW